MSYEEAEEVLAGYYNFPSETLLEARELEDKPDLPGLVYALDRLWQFNSGPVLATRMLRGYYPKEFGVDVHHLILRPDGVELIKELIDETVEKATSHA